jgi:hypothetical protein
VADDEIGVPQEFNTTANIFGTVETEVFIGIEIMKT